MEYIRFLHIADFDPILGRFRSTCFSPSSNGTGISVVQQTCAIAESQSVCEHGRRHYGPLARVTSEPPIYLSFDPLRFFADHSISPDPEDDICHFNLTNVSKSVAEKFIKNKLVVRGQLQSSVNVGMMFIC